MSVIGLGGGLKDGMLGGWVRASGEAKWRDGGWAVLVLY